MFQTVLDILQGLRLDVDHVHLARLCHSFYESPGEIARARAKIGDTHPWFQDESFDDLRRLLILVPLRPLKPVEILHDVRHGVVLMSRLGGSGGGCLERQQTKDQRDDSAVTTGLIYRTAKRTVYERLE